MILGVFMSHSTKNVEIVELNDYASVGMIGYTWIL